MSQFVTPRVQYIRSMSGVLHKVKFFESIDSDSPGKVYFEVMTDLEDRVEVESLDKALSDADLKI